MDPVTDPLDFNNQEDNVGAQDQAGPSLDPLVLASFDGFSSGQVNGTLQLDQENQTQREFQSQLQETLPMSYEPLVFPSMGIQFLSCDLIQSGGDLLQEYSPLGIRQLLRTTSVNCFSTTVNVQQPHGVIVEHASVENSGIFGKTPLKNSLESPTAWKSPWSPFVPGPLDTYITLGDVEGYFPIPGERSYDALGLMKELSEQTAPAYVNAPEVLGDETPDLLKKRLLQKSESSRQDSNILSSR